MLDDLTKYSRYERYSNTTSHLPLLCWVDHIWCAKEYQSVPYKPHGLSDGQQYAAMVTV